MIWRILIIFFCLSSPLVAQDDLQPTGIEGLEKSSWVILDTDYTVKGDRIISVPEANLKGKEVNYVAFYVKNELVMVDEIPPYALEYNFGNFTQKVRIVAVAVQYRLQEPEKPKAESVSTSGQDETEGLATSMDLDDGSSSNEAESFIIDGSTVSILSPTSDIYAYGVMTIKAEVNAPVEAIVRVDFEVDDMIVGSVEEPPFETDHNFGRGFNEQTVEVIAYFNNGQRAQASMVTTPLEQSDFFVRSQLVTVEATVVDWRDRIVTDLTKDDFLLWEDGAEQEITHFSVEQRPLRVAILLDASGSMAERNKMTRAINAAQEFLSFLDPEKDKVALVAFTDVPNLMSGFTNDFVKIQKIMMAIQPNGGTAISDTLDASSELFEGEIGRKAIVLVTDGIDQHSTIDVGQAVEKIKAADAKVYSIGIYQDDYFEQQTQNNMTAPKTHRGKAPDLDPTDARKRDQTFKRGLDNRTVMFEGFADATGGAAFFPETLRELPIIFNRIAEELRNSYAIGYIPKNKERDGKWREINMEVNRSGLTVKAKSGYKASK
jgi:Ca-activated chloride channel family protein